MLIGTADIELLGADAPAVETLQDEALHLEQVEVLQILYEMPGSCREVLLPPALHPTDPPVIAWLFYRCPTSPWGPFTLAQTRIECRSGLRLRAFLMSAVIDNKQAGAALQTKWGYRIRPGEVSLQRHYDAVRATVELGDCAILDVAMRDPDLLSADSIQYVAGMHLARTARGLRLLQVEPKHTVQRAERGRPQVLRFDAAAWGDGRVQPVHPISASLAVADVTLPPVRFVCRPDVLAFEGTEPAGLGHAG